MDNARHIETLPDSFLVIRVNAFTGKMDDGYLRTGGRMVGSVMRPEAVGAYIAENPTVRIDLLRT